MVYMLRSSSADQDCIVIEPKFLPDEAFQFLVRGLPVPPSLVPARLRIAANASVPHLLDWKRQWLISKDARELLETLVPGAIDYVPVIITPSGASREVSGYSFVNIAQRDRLIDYQKSVCDQDRAIMTGGRTVTSVSILSVGIVFHPHPKYYIWHEESYFVGDDYFSATESQVFLSDQLWEEIECAFPGELSPSKLR